MLPASRDGRRVHVVREPETDPRAQQFIEGLIRSCGGELYTTHFADDPQLGMDLLDALRRGEVVALQGDRPRAGGRTVEARLFGRPFALPVGPAALARAAGVPIVPVFVLREGRLRYRCLLRPGDRASRRATTASATSARRSDRFTADLEEAIRPRAPPVVLLPAALARREVIKSIVDSLVICDSSGRGPMQRRSIRRAALRKLSSRKEPNHAYSFRYRASSPAILAPPAGPPPAAAAKASGDDPGDRARRRRAVLLRFAHNIKTCASVHIETQMALAVGASVRLDGEDLRRRLDGARATTWRPALVLEAHGRAGRRPQGAALGGGQSPRGEGPHLPRLERQGPQPGAERRGHPGARRRPRGQGQGRPPAPAGEAGSRGRRGRSRERASRGADSPASRHSRTPPRNQSTSRKPSRAARAPALPAAHAVDPIAVEHQRDRGAVGAGPTRRHRRARSPREVEEGEAERPGRWPIGKSRASRRSNRMRPRGGRSAASPGSPAAGGPPARRPRPPAPPAARRPARHSLQPARKDAGVEAGQGEQQVAEVETRVARVLAVEDEGGVQAHRVAGAGPEGGEAAADLGGVRPAAARREERRGGRRGGCRGCDRRRRWGASPSAPSPGRRARRGAGRRPGPSCRRSSRRPIPPPRRAAGRNAGDGGGGAAGRVEIAAGGAPGGEPAVEDADLGASRPAQEPVGTGDRLAMDRHRSGPSPGRRSPARRAARGGRRGHRRGRRRGRRRDPRRRGGWRPPPAPRRARDCDQDARQGGGVMWGARRARRRDRPLDRRALAGGENPGQEKKRERPGSSFHGHERC